MIVQPIFSCFSINNKNNYIAKRDFDRRPGGHVYNFPHFYIPKKKYIYTLYRLSFFFLFFVAHLLRAVLVVVVGNKDGAAATRISCPSTKRHFIIIYLLIIDDVQLELRGTTSPRR